MINIVDEGGPRETSNSSGENLYDLGDNSSDEGDVGDASAFSK
jgi:hypothetical protein